MLLCTCQNFNEKSNWNRFGHQEYSKLFSPAGLRKSLQIYSWSKISQKLVLLRWRQYFPVCSINMTEDTGTGDNTTRRPHHLNCDRWEGQNGNIFLCWNQTVYAIWYSLVSDFVIWIVLSAWWQLSWNGTSVKTSGYIDLSVFMSEWLNMAICRSCSQNWYQKPFVT